MGNMFTLSTTEQGELTLHAVSLAHAWFLLFWVASFLEESALSLSFAYSRKSDLDPEASGCGNANHTTGDLRRPFKGVGVMPTASTLPLSQQPLPC